MKSVISNVLGAVAAAAALTLFAGCGGPPSKATTDDAAGTVQTLGKVPIPTAPTAAVIPTATADKFQLVAIGAPVRANLPAGASVLITALGPDVKLLGAAPTVAKSVQGVITITEDGPGTGTGTGTPVKLDPADFSSRDDTGSDITLTAVAGASATSLRLAGTFPAGAAQITWRQGGKPIVVWDFNVELD